MRFFRHAEKAVELFHKGRYRESADEYYKAFTLCPSVNDSLRYQIFHGYTDILKSEYFEATDEDSEHVRKVLNDKHEPRLYRIEAGLALGLLLYTRGERFQTADAYHQAIAIGEKELSAKQAKKERQWKVQYNTEMRTMKELQDETLITLRNNLGNMTGESYSPPSEGSFTRSDGSFKMPRGMAQKVCFGMGGTSLTPRVMNQLLEIGGVRCDYCKQKESKDVKIFKCQGCQRAYYCSRDCQRRQWKDKNHKKYCRAAKVFEAGDFVILNGLKSKPELNGNVLKVVGPVAGTGNNDDVSKKRWEVKMEGGDKTISVAAKNIHHLRPYDVVDGGFSESSMKE